MSTSQAKKLQELSVYGFIRKYSVLPEVLIELCLSFYLILIDEWNKEVCDESFTINNDTGELVSNGEEKWRNAFGSWIIKKGDTQTWIIKITNENPREDVARAFLYGIVQYTTQNDIEKYNKNETYFTDGRLEFGCGYGFFSYSGCVQSNLITDYKAYGPDTCDKNDVLSMTLDLSGNNGVLSYKLNDTPLGIAFDNIDVNKKYCMVVCVYFNDNFQLILP